MALRKEHPPGSPSARDHDADTESAVAPPLGAAEREWLLDSVIASQALEGVHISREVATRLLDEVLAEPLPAIG